MRRMANGTALDADRGVLEEKGPMLVDVARRACLPIGTGERRAVFSAMGVMAISALHRPFGHAVMKRLRELRTRRAVARVTQLWLGLLQQTLAQPSPIGVQLWHLKELCLCRRRHRRTGWTDRLDQVGGMARLAADSSACVSRVAELLLPPAAAVAGQAACHVFL
jgi:hypothetical protein